MPRSQRGGEGRLTVKNYTTADFMERYQLLETGARILNAGSSATRWGENCINVDVQAKPNVDLVCDLHDLPETLGPFDAVVCNAVLQYCHSPHIVARRLHAVLAPGGLMFVDAPWVQPFSLDTPDLYRFSEQALRAIFTDFEIVECGPSIRPGSALRMLAVAMARGATGSPYVNFAFAGTVGALLYPLRRVRTAREAHTAGAFYLIARKPGPASTQNP